MNKKSKTKVKLQQRKHTDTDSAVGSSSEKVNGSVSDSTKAQDHKQREMERTERETIVLWKSPFRTIRYFFLEASVLLYMLGQR